MLRFLSTVFTTRREPGDVIDKALIERAIERVVEGTDPRLRGLGNYRKRLRKPVETAATHVIALVDGLPAPTEISRRAYGIDPRLRAFFVSAAQLQEVIGGSKAVGDYRRATAGPLPDRLYGLLTMEWQEKNVLGMEMRGETLQRDVPKVAVNFFHHRFLGLSGSEEETRWYLKVRGFDYLVERALERIVTTRGKRVELEQQQRLLKRKLDAMKAGNWGLGAMLADAEPGRPDHQTLEAEIDAIEAQLLALGGGALNLEDIATAIDATLGQPADWLAWRDMEMNLDNMLIKVDADSASANRLQLVELYASSGERRVVLPGWYPCDDLPEQPDFLKEAARYLR